MGLFKPSDRENGEQSSMSLLKWLFILAIIGIVAAVIVKQLVS